ncbi:pentapeptide repeat-containing protein [Streptomyces prasinus]|uniref:pentapeptide repeat-containing protein n=1 Tax=Streptomyces prasinus TaxID=67345 RepID=UPI00362C0A28
MRCEGAFFSGAFFSGAFFSGAFLSGAFLSGFLVSGFLVLSFPEAVSAGFGAGRAGAAFPPGRVSRWPGRIRSGSAPTVALFASYRPRQPPRTRSSSAMPERVSPWSTMYISARPARDWGVFCGSTSLTVVVPAPLPPPALAPGPVSLPVPFLAPVPASLPASVLPAGRMSGVLPPRASPARCEHTGQAPGPWPSRTFSAMAICWSLVARSARGAYRVPPKASQVDWVNWSPP